MSAKFNKVSVIDVFAGPGGLGEGFSSCENSPFKIEISVEFEANAHKTLTLRSLFRKLTLQERENYYYPYIKSCTEEDKRKNFTSLIGNCAKKWEAAKEETLGAPHALGNANKWKKIKNGETLTPEDLLPTEQENRIFNRIKEIKTQARSEGNPVILIGGPPCQAYSVNGRNRIRAEKDYTPENDERFFLYQEYLKVIDAGDPDIFVMENVEGILSAKLATGELIFNKIRKEIQRADSNGMPKYNIYSLVLPPDESDEASPNYENDHDYVIKASDFGVPQARKRVILLGVRSEFGIIEQFMKPNSESAPCTQILLDDLPKIRSALSKRSGQDDSSDNWINAWKENINELMIILKDQEQVESVAHRWVALEQNQRRKSQKAILTKSEIEAKKDAFKKNEIKPSFLATLQVLESYLGQQDDCKLETGSDYFLNSKLSQSCLNEEYTHLSRWLITDLKGVVNHKTRGHMKEDLKRYMFSAAWAKAHKDKPSPFPKSKDFPTALSPEHKNWESGHQADRFRTVGEAMIPLTITSHLRKDGHAQIHYDLTQNRSLTVREAARIQTFPDDYYFEGPQGWQFQQVGNAVPPYLAKQIAEHVLKLLQCKFKVSET